MSIQVFDFQGNKKGEESIPQSLVLDSINEHLIYEVITAELNNKRQGTHQTKTKGMVRGGGAKPWRQKGTGRARAGSNRSPVWVGGGVVFGPQPRDYSQKVNKKKKKAGVKNILAKKFQEDSVVILDSWKMDAISTQNAFQGFNSIIQASVLKERYNKDRKYQSKSNDKRRKLTVVVADDNRENRISVRNIPWLKLIHVDRLAALPLLHNFGLVFTKDAYKKISESFGVN